MFNWYKRVILPRLLNSGMGSMELEEIRHQVLIDAQGVTLEIGSGPGYNFPLYENITRLYALEPLQELIEISKARASSLSFPLEFLNSGAENVPLPDKSVDTVVSTWTLCSVTDPAKALSELIRVLRPGGRFIFVDHGASPSVLLHTIQSLLTAFTKYFTGNCHFNRRLEKLIKQAGFEVEKIEHPRELYNPLIYNYKGVAVRPGAPKAS